MYVLVTQSIAQHITKITMGFSWIMNESNLSINHLDLSRQLWLAHCLSITIKQHDESNQIFLLLILTSKLPYYSTRLLKATFPQAYVQYNKNWMFWSESHVWGQENGPEDDCSKRTFGRTLTTDWQKVYILLRITLWVLKFWYKKAWVQWEACCYKLEACCMVLITYVQRL